MTAFGLVVCPYVTSRSPIGEEERAALEQDLLGNFGKKAACFPLPVVFFCSVEAARVTMSTSKMLGAGSQARCSAATVSSLFLTPCF